ncbi:MAG: hypothetical protein GC138_03305 [Gammaproteobacteria bacterium]|nr:hypothetical protein [Gammaproteobacteria bacterium]
MRQNDKPKPVAAPISRAHARASISGRTVLRFLPFTEQAPNNGSVKATKTPRKAALFTKKILNCSVIHSTSHPNPLPLPEQRTTNNEQRTTDD